MVRALYDWVVMWADKPSGTIALGALAFAESSFFPIPPDVLLIALCTANPEKAFTYAFVCSIGSCMGGCLGYGIGRYAEPLGMRVIRFFKCEAQFDKVRKYYGKNAFWGISVAGFTPIPYKVFTIAAGICYKTVSIFTLIGASAMSRSARFFIVAGIIYMIGDTAKEYIEKYFNLLSITFVVLLVGGFLAMKYLHGKQKTEEV